MIHGSKMTNSIYHIVEKKNSDRAKFYNTRISGQKINKIGLKEVLI